MLRHTWLSIEVHILATCDPIWGTGYIGEIKICKQLRENVVGKGPMVGCRAIHVLQLESTHNIVTQRLLRIGCAWASVIVKCMHTRTHAHTHTQTHTHKHHRERERERERKQNASTYQPNRC